mgnify:FL=1
MIEHIFLTAIYKSNILTVDRNAEYWDWRYVNYFGKFKYQIFTDDMNSGGIIVTRIETIKCWKENISDIEKISTENSASTKHLNNENYVLRIIECIPGSNDFWTIGKEDIDFKIMLQRVLLWAKNKGCILADFHFSYENIISTLNYNGLLIDNGTVPKIFNNIYKEVDDINYVYWNRDNELIKNVYFVKSDGDMDRPQL